jgi:hypothetical protein
MNGLFTALSAPRSHVGQIVVGGNTAAKRTNPAKPFALPALENLLGLFDCSESHEKTSENLREAVSLVHASSKPKKHLKLRSSA